MAFVAALRAAEKVPVKEFERDIPYFEGCLPIEVMAERGLDTLRYGPMKPVGLPDPRTGRLPHAVVQLRQDDLAADALEPGRLPDPHDVRRAAARCSASSRASSSARFARLRHDPPQHLRLRAAPPGRRSCA